MGPRGSPKSHKLHINGATVWLNGCWTSVHNLRAVEPISRGERRSFLSKCRIRFIACPSHASSNTNTIGILSILTCSVCVSDYIQGSYGGLRYACITLDTIFMFIWKGLCSFNVHCAGYDLAGRRLLGRYTLGTACLKLRISLQDYERGKECDG